jgi:hypothetical protein
MIHGRIAHEERRSKTLHRVFELHTIGNAPLTTFAPTADQHYQTPIRASRPPGLYWLLGE